MSMGKHGEKFPYCDEWEIFDKNPISWELFNSSYIPYRMVLTIQFYTKFSDEYLFYIIAIIIIKLVSLVQKINDQNRVVN